LKYDRNKPRVSLAGQHLGVLVLMADGSTQILRDTIDEKKLHALFTRAGGEVIELDRTDVVEAGPSRGNAFGIPGIRKEDLDRLNIKELLTKAIGDHVSLNVYDASPTLAFNQQA